MLISNWFRYVIISENFSNWVRVTFYFLAFKKKIINIILIFLLHVYLAETIVITEIFKIF